MDNKLSELKDALEFLETTEFDGEWDSALVGGENGKNYHAVINANDVVVRADDDSRHTSWLCDYLEAVSPVNIRALLAELEAKDKRIAELERANQSQDDHINQQQDRIDSLEKTNAGLGQRLGAAEKRLAKPVRLPETYSPEPWMGPDPSGTWLEKEDVKASIRAAGFTVEWDEP
ncbi:SlyX family protein [Serratia marcescens]|uniref:SlyX family protein n=1 Tax=Serratia marcescens TaxID=615 RepID=UPI0013788FC9|nr:SlyX family protein [Serratia marcescens]MBH3207557.1 hypothetical protein [Serratia marcescens]NCI54412.1 SlyX family protein [Serratia marcescens]NDJ05687.1 SlyX family protein [Serratia marcescens]NDJ29969.1 SlyX family protein [Serratia marcescens]NDJ42836.1 SlyX family protein [Serratia marcescens]